MATDTPVPSSSTNARDSYQCLARALTGFSRAVSESADVGELARRSLATLVEIAHADVALLCLREGELLRARASVGLGDEAEDFTLPFAAEPDASKFSDALSRGDALREGELSAARCVALRSGSLAVGALYLATREGHALRDDAMHLVGLLAPLVATALSRQAKLASLQQAVQARDQVLAVVAHDLRNPINVISLAANTLLHRVPDTALRRPVERIVRGVQRADRLIQDLLEISAIEGGRFTIERRRVEPAKVILAALESQQSIAAKASIILTTDLSPELPAVEGDAERLLEVLENLIGNSIKFTSPGGSVTVGASRRDDEVLIWVKDNGSGIPAEQLPYLFDRFWQAGRTDRRGTGLGLTICKAIVEAHDGQIWPESGIGKGTRMCFTLPAAAEPAPVKKAEETSNILIVDDRPENLMSLRAILERPGYRLVSASSGEEALRLALRERFEVALIDIAMPGMNGLEVAVHLKELERSRDIPIIFITAFGDDPEEIHRAYSAGGADYLVKPLDAEIVRKKVAVFIDLYRRRHEA
jgi:signal transduction histidine kinase/CheY-like chemotaxis protein